MKKQTTAVKPAKASGRSKATKPIKNQEDVQLSNDEHIDQDFPGFPHAPSESSIIRNGSAGAFEATENILDEYDSDEDDDDRERDKSHY